MLGYGVVGTIVLVALIVWLGGELEISTRMRLLMLAFCGMLLLASAGAFLLYVSILSILTVVVILMAAMLMFLLGVQLKSSGVEFRKFLPK